jgi:transcription initiation factor TFIIH subunit 4
MLVRDRFGFMEGILYNQFHSQADYDTVKNYADNQGVVLWCKDDKRTLVVTNDRHNDVKRYWRQHSSR